MSPLKTSLITAVLSATLTAGCLYTMHQRDAAEARALRRQNNRMTLDAVQRQKAAAVPAAEPRTIVMPAESAPQIAAAPAAVPVTERVLPNYRNEGQTTARAALQTFAWACDMGDAAVVARLIHFDEDARAHATVWFDSLPPDKKGQWRTIDEMAASLLTVAGMSSPFPGADVLEHVVIEEINDGRARLRLPGTRRNGTEFQRTPDGWKYVVTAAMVEGYLRSVASGR